MRADTAEAPQMDAIGRGNRHAVDQVEKLETSSARKHLWRVGKATNFQK